MSCKAQIPPGMLQMQEEAGQAGNILGILIPSPSCNQGEGQLAPRRDTLLQALSYPARKGQCTVKGGFGGLSLPAMLVGCQLCKSAVPTQFPRYPGKTVQWQEWGRTFCPLRKSTGIQITAL